MTNTLNSSYKAIIDHIKEKSVPDGYVLSPKSVAVMLLCDKARSTSRHYYGKNSYFEMLHNSINKKTREVYRPGRLVVKVASGVSSEGVHPIDTVISVDTWHPATHYKNGGYIYREPMVQLVGESNPINCYMLLALDKVDSSD